MAASTLAPCAILAKKRSLPCSCIEDTCSTGIEDIVEEAVHALYTVYKKYKNNVNKSLPFALEA